MDSRSGEEVRTAATALLADPRSRIFVVPDQPAGEWRPLEMADLCRAVAELDLPLGVDADVRQQFDVARNLLIYAWFVYRFHAVSQLQSLRTLELALRRRVPSAERVRGLKKLLNAALEAGCLRSEDFATVDAGPTLGGVLHDAQRRAAGQMPLKSHEHTIEFICHVRNGLAHGEPWLHPQSGLFLQIVASLIAGVYRAPAA